MLGGGPGLRNLDFLVPTDQTGTSQMEPFRGLGRNDQTLPSSPPPPSRQEGNLDTPGCIRVFGVPPNVDTIIVHRRSAVLHVFREG